MISLAVLHFLFINAPFGLVWSPLIEEESINTHWRSYADLSSPASQSRGEDRIPILF